MRGRAPGSDGRRGRTLAERHMGSVGGSREWGLGERRSAPRHPPGAAGSARDQAPPSEPQPRLVSSPEGVYTATLPRWRKLHDTPEAR
jgi:hypothetical protein